MFAAAGAGETAEAGALEEAGLDAAEGAALEGVEVVVLDEDDGAAGLDDAEGVPAVQEEPGVTTTTCEEAPDDGQLITPDRAELTALAAAEDALLVGAAFLVHEAPFWPKSDCTYCWISLQVPCTLQTTVLQADSTGLHAVCAA